ncbi:acetamidase/formamidase family protein [Bacillus daqingensis]|uniref:Acetamidase/formamidase family protein n=1 Tax=Bacillus daqingensis TaxID=872396 RepID=A0ABV9NSH7_9BACI
MMHHTIPLSQSVLRGSFSRDYDPVLTAASEDTITFQTPDIEWGYSPEPGKAVRTLRPAAEEADPKHPVIGPIEIQGASPGMTVEVRIQKLETGWYGRSWGGGAGTWQSEAMQLTGDRTAIDWRLDRETSTATADIGDVSYTVPMQPFLGLIALQPRGRDVYPTPPPYYTGGNIDCRELTAGSSLFLPVETEGAMLYAGDGHAAQGDGEVSGTAIECPMDKASIQIILHPDMTLTQPYAKTPAGLVTFGFDTDLNIACANALRDMNRRMAAAFQITEEQAAALAGAVVDLRITQVVNGVKGVHAVLPEDRLHVAGLASDSS